MTGAIRTTTPIPILRGNAATRAEPFEMATEIIKAAMKITGWGRGSQSVKLILLFPEISTGYGRASERDGISLFRAHFPLQETSKIEAR